MTPTDWTMVPLGDVITLKYGKALKKADRDGGDFPVFGSNGKVGGNSTALTAGPVVVVGRKGAAGEAHYSAEHCWPIDTTYFVNDFSFFDPRFCYFQIRSLNLRKLETSTAIPGLNRDDAYREPYAIAPIVEQRAIVLKIETLFSELDQGVAQLEAVRLQLKQYRQSILESAVSGDLTREWRDQGSDEIESAKSLLSRSLFVRQKSWESQTLENYKRRGTKPATGWRDRYANPADPNGKLNTKLPGTWETTTTHQLCGTITSGSRAWKKYYGGGTGTFIMAGNVRMGLLDMTKRQAVAPPPDDPDARRSQVRPNDLLVTIVGANTGDVCLVEEELPEHYVCQSVALMRLSLPQLSKWMLLFFTAASGAQSQFKTFMYGAGRPHLSFENLEGTLIPLPPLDEQTVIIEAVGEKLSRIDDLAAEVDHSLERANALRQSILKKAFAGKLLTDTELADVRAHPDYEPADQLLHRIREEREQKPVAKKKRPPRKKKAGARS